MGSSFDFSKYHGAGNDFILVDQRRENYIHPHNQPLIAHLCHRRFGIGADGLILLQQAEGYDFNMLYFNADGGPGSLCGNGGRCTVAFAHHLGIVEKSCRFLASDGPHEARIFQSGNWVELQMADVTDVRQLDNDTFVLDTGSPHYVSFQAEADLAHFPVVASGREIRNSAPFRENGINVNFVATRSGGLSIRTYERGVEDETLACGTGVTAAALAYHLLQGGGGGAAEIAVYALGGQLSVRFERDSSGAFRNIWLCGPAKHVFSGSYTQI